MRPVIVCLCGSTRFGQAFKDAMREETLAGKIVLSVGLLGHEEGIDMSGPVKAMLDELHLRKIDEASEVLVLNARAYTCEKCRKVVSHEAFEANLSACCQSGVGYHPYIGDSTRREIEYATKHGKIVRYLNPPEEPKDV